MEFVAALAIGYMAGVVAGMLGVGGGILFVPALVLGFHLAHVEAEATSLLAIVPVSMVGSWRQHTYGNVRWRDAILLGVLATGGAIVGVVIVNAVPERVIQLLFAGLLFFVAAQLVRRGLSSERDGDDARGDR
jgi:uncharacterized membrane protein YfcA